MTLATSLALAFPLLFTATAIERGPTSPLRAEQRGDVRRGVEVQGPRITLADVLPTAPRHLLGVDIAPSPAPGKTTMITRAAVAAALERAGADQRLADSLPARQDVSRQAQRLSSNELAQYIRDAVASKIPLGVSVERIVGLSDHFVSVGDLEVDVRLGRLAQATKASVTVSIGGRIEERFSATLVLSGQPRLPTLRADLPRGSTIAPSDVELRETDFADFRTRSVVRPSELVGKQLTQPGVSGRPVQRAAVKQPPVIQRGAQINIVAVAPGLRITQLGTAQEAGALGEIIRIQTDTGMLRGRVEGPGEARIVLGGFR